MCLGLSGLEDKECWVWSEVKGHGEMVKMMVRHLMCGKSAKREEEEADLNYLMT